MADRPTTTSAASADLLRTAHTMAVDATSFEVVSALARAGVPCVLLKGPSLTAWLYEDGGRSYVDSDVIVAPERLAQAQDVLRAAGFVPGQDAPGRRSEVSQPWQRSDGRNVDLHCSLHGATEAPQRVWEALRAHVEPLALDRGAVPALDLPGRALLVALHAQQHADRPVGKPWVDLRRALERADDVTWQRAADLALSLGAERSFVQGLALVPEGAALLARLPLGRALHRARLRPLAVARLRLGAAASARERTRVLRDLVAPDPRTMRWRSSLARRGRKGLAAAYLLRFVRRGPGGAGDRLRA